MRSGACGTGAEGLAAGVMTLLERSQSSAALRTWCRDELLREQRERVPDDRLHGRSRVAARRQPGDDVAHLGRTEAERAKPPRGGLERGRPYVRTAHLVSDQLSLSEVDTLHDVRATEDLLGVQTVMRATPRAQVCSLIASAAGASLDVIELEEPASGAPVALGVDIRAPLGVTSVDLADDRARNMAAPRRSLGW